MSRPNCCWSLPRSPREMSSMGSRTALFTENSNTVWAQTLERSLKQNTHHALRTQYQSCDLYVTQNSQIAIDLWTLITVYLLVPASNTLRIAEELAGIDHWCLTNNQKLNVSKSAELIMRRKGCRAPIDSTLTPGIGHVNIAYWCSV